MSAADRNLEQYQAFRATPNYIKHKAEEDCVAILVSQIKIWQAKGVDWFTVPNVNQCLTIRECESIEVTDSAKELIGKAVVRFPRGTVISKSFDSGKTVTNGNVDEGNEKKESLDIATNNGEVMTPQAAQYNENSASTTSMAVHYDDKGLLDFNRTQRDIALLSPNDIAIGNRIEIRLGYAYSEDEYNRMNASENNLNLDLVFTGFITSVSVDTPLEIECSNMAHVLTTFNVPDITMKNGLAVKEFLDPGSRFHLLEDTGIELADSSKGCDIWVHGGSISHNLSVADVLTEWGKDGRVLCVMENNSQTGVSKLKVGMSYYSGHGGNALPNSDKKYITYNGGNQSLMIIQFDWDVAKDNLKLVHNDKKYLAVEALGWHKKNATQWECIKVTIMKSPDKDDEGWIVNDNGDVDFDGQFRVVNKRTNVIGAKMKKKKGTKNANSTSEKAKHITDKVGMKKYNVIHYVSANSNITEEQLIEDAKQYWNSYVPNGISGSIEVFGDIIVKPTDIIGLIDPRRPEKNGYYYVESVNTSFGMGGYRRELKLPYKIASFKQTINYL